MRSTYINVHCASYIQTFAIKIIIADFAAKSPKIGIFFAFDFIFIA
ncbi:hypothetical protein HMPREF1581_00155 [Gardnerella vaginalis JCP8108]|uniref:Uncharacterized protein n=1 Tax=Gardnerella vaginalis JCP8108 TaxID=1261066 RepID=S4GJK1_GARVA|nr:hypothetical protein HMPREF1581_00155 [Gardnerella vaginalis JCP8108]